MTDKVRGSALHAACYARHTELIEFLLEKQADPNAFHNDLTPLMVGKPFFVYTEQKNANYPFFLVDNSFRAT